MKSVVRKIVARLRPLRHRFYRLLDRPALLRRSVGLDVRRIVEIAQKAAPQDGKYHVVVTSTGNQNIGDQAMFEAYIQGVPGEILAICAPRSTYTVPEDARSRVTMLTLGGLIYKRGPAHKSSIRQFAQLLSTAKSVSVVGADIMDGGYQLRASAIEWGLATAAARAGISSRVLGFSWKEKVDPLITELAREAGAAGVTLLARDPRSAARLTRLDIPNVVTASDMVFSLTGADSSTEAHQWLSEWKDDGLRTCLLNVSGLISSRVDLADDYLALIGHLESAGYRILLVPHVSDVIGGDFTAGEAIRTTALSRLNVSLDTIPRLYRPQQIRALASKADLVITGRMHLSILSMNVGTPAIVLSTQGKVEGLMEMVGLPTWGLEPEVGFSDKAISLIDERVEAMESARAALQSNLDDVRQLSRLNFAGLV